MICCAGLICGPDFVVARDLCYVDKDADDEGDGSDDKPYQDIEKALNKDCQNITVAKGTYNDDITIPVGTSITGKSRDEVTITGSITMKDDSVLSGVTVSGKDGVAVGEDAEIEIKNVTITGADIGVETVSGSGKVTMRDTKINDGKKGMYLQSGNTVKITSCEIYDNDEEGIDIRSNVDGTISGNTISSNGESGIEVILGKADLLITDNKIKKNGASGVATQYYKGSGKSGAVKIKSNTITDNSDFGINCKTPSGGNPGAEFWGQTLNMSSNKVSNNKDGEFAPDCSLDEVTMSDATMTQKQKDAAAKIKYEAEQKALAEAQQKKDEQQANLVTEAQAQQEKDAAQRAEEERQQEIMRQQLQSDKEQIDMATTAVTQLQNVFMQDQQAMDQIQERNAFVMFLIGPKRDALNAIAQNSVLYTSEIETVQNAITNMKDQEQKNVLQAQVDDLSQKQKQLEEFVLQYEEEFSLFGWIFNRQA